jgi:hypothetical protein
MRSMIFKDNLKLKAVFEDKKSLKTIEPLLSRTGD